MQVIVAESSLQATADRLLDQDGIDSVTITAEDSPSGSAPVTADGIQAQGPPGTPAPEPTVVDGEVLLQATLTDAADSPAAEQTVRAVRADLAAQELDALVGGVTATSIDTNDTSAHVRALIIAVRHVVFGLVLMLLLRAGLAPVRRILATELSFGTATGISVRMSDRVYDFPGADPAVPLFCFVF